MALYFVGKTRLPSAILCVGVQKQMSLMCFAHVVIFVCNL
jgi:hypothetical protein